MDIIKYFYEEPTLLEPLTPDTQPDARQQTHRTTRADVQPTQQSLADFLAAPDYYRGYLAGSNRTSDRVGLTAIEQPAAFVEPMVQALGGACWTRATPDGTVGAIDGTGARQIFRDPSCTAVLVTADALVEADLVNAVAGVQRRYALPALRTLLDAAHVAFFPEPAHDGFDWSFFSAQPLRDILVQEFKQNPAEDVRRFVLPYQKARSESKFYFETWQLNGPSLPDHIEEV